MYPCTCGEMLTKSVQENAANKTAVMRTRTQVCERPELFIGFGACGNRRNRASNFLLDCRFCTLQNQYEDASHCPSFRKILRTRPGLARRNNSCLERNTMI